LVEGLKMPEIQEVLYFSGPSNATFLIDKILTKKENKMPKAKVHHEGLNITFTLKIEPEIFKRRADDEAIECFDDKGTCRKFQKSFLKVVDSGTPNTPTEKKKRKPKKDKETSDHEEETEEETNGDEIRDIAEKLTENNPNNQ
jgi:hypothetical protein